MNLIYDRTAADVERALALAKKAEAGTLTDAEKTEWLAGMKGCYNAADMNRVEAAVKTLSAALTSAGYPVSVTPVLKGSKAEDREWRESDTVRLSQWRQYLANVQALRDAYYTLAETGQLPDAEDRLDYIGANAIEKVLADIDLLLDGMKSVYRRAGTFTAGGSYTRQMIRSI